MKKLFTILFLFSFVQGFGQVKVSQLNWAHHGNDGDRYYVIQNIGGQDSSFKQRRDSMLADMKRYVDSLFSISGGWSLTGNAGTNPSTDFIGTMDSSRLVFKVNNVICGMFTDVNISFLNFCGFQSGLNNSGNHINSFGFNSALNNSGNYVSASGESVATANTGDYLSAYGIFSGVSNSGNNVDAYGYNAAHGNSGNNVDAYGYNAGYNYLAGIGNIRNYVNLFGRNSFSNKDSSTIIGDTIINKYTGIGTTYPLATIHAKNQNGTFPVAIFDGSNVGIGTTTPDASSVLDVTSTTRGFLPPRMTGTQAEAISSPAEGLMIYSTDGSGSTITSKGWWGWDGSAWTKLN